MERFSWTQGDEGTRSLDMRIIHKPDGTVEVTNLKEQNQAKEYASEAEAASDFATLLKR